MTVRFLRIILLLTVVATACSSDKPAAVARVSGDIVVTRDDPSLPEGCRPANVAEFVISFLDEVNEGEVEIGRFFPSSGNFNFYGVITGDPKGDGDLFRVQRPEQLPPYFKERHRQRERIELKKIFVRGDAESMTASVVFELERTAKDLRRFGVDHTIATGKAGINCDDHFFIQWAHFQHEQPDGSTNLLCPDPPSQWEDKVVACAPPPE